MNQLFQGDCLDVMRAEIEDGSVDLIYMDPPYCTGRDFGDFNDRWDSLDSYLGFMEARLEECRRVLASAGSVYLHCDHRASHYLKVMMDALFGAKNFRNEIMWGRYSYGRSNNQYASKTWGNVTDSILYYVGGAASILRSRRLPNEMSPAELEKKFDRVDENGNRYYDDSSHIFRSPGRGPRPTLCYTWRGYSAPHPSGWCLSKQRLEQEFQKRNIRIRSNGRLERRKYLRDYRGTLRGNLWIDIPHMNSQAKERTGYATQKPLALLDRIILASSNEGDTVLDPFCGSGTALVSAANNDRCWIGIDQNPRAIEISRQRLDEVRQGDLI